MDVSIWQGVGIVALCGVSCVLALAWVRGAGRGTHGLRFPMASSRTCVFLFEGADLTSTTPSAEDLISDQTDGADWLRLHAALIDRFPTFPPEPDSVPPVGSTVFEPVDDDDPWRVLVEPIADTLRVELVPREPIEAGNNVISFVHRGVMHELRQLRTITSGAPCPMWKVNAEGREVWHNPAYATLYQAALGTTPVASAPLFADHREGDASSGRYRLALSDGRQTGWYDVTGLPHNDGALFYALDVAPIVTAEATQRNFVQTLAKTFAQLSIGLAIFDRDMRLVLFNPALIDLTGMPADFLSARPNLLSFFDRLRDARVMPEPKNYSGWREQMAAMVAAANDGEYCETWSLSTGSTYRVSGRPHPDGAVAFLIEDISAEVSLTRRFRSDLELGQSILDAMSDAVAVFSAGGVLSVTNAAYCTMWGTDPDNSFAETTIIDCLRDWQRLSDPSPHWGEIRDFVLGQENRAEWSAPVHLKDGGRHICHVHPMPNGATLLRISSANAPSQRIAITEKAATG